MATQQPNQQQQGQAVTRREKRGEYPLGLQMTPHEFFRVNPFNLMRRMSEELDRVFGEPLGRGEQMERVWAPAIEVSQQDNNYVVRAEIPGINPNDVKLEVTDDAVIIQGERKVEREEERGGMHVSERRYGRFYRAIPLPEGAKAEEARAKCENGVLEVTVPTAEQRTKRREIPIQGISEQPGGKSGSGKTA